LSLNALKEEGQLSSLKIMGFRNDKKFVGSEFPSFGGVAKIQRIFDGVVPYTTLLKKSHRNFKFL